jgi:hypothetical protein
MRFAEFLRTTVLLSAAAATLLAAVTVLGAVDSTDSLLVPISAAWWIISGAAGGWAGRRAATSSAIAHLLASAKTRSSLPEVDPGRTLLNRLWPLLLITVGAGAMGLVLPQVPAIAAGFAVIWALAWRRQSSAVTAIEERDGARFYVENSSSLKPIRLVRTPGFRSNLLDFRGVPSSPTARPRT